MARSGPSAPTSLALLSALLRRDAELWPLEHASLSGGQPATQSDLRLQHKLRARAVGWLQRDESAEHRHFGSAGEPQWDEASGRYVPEPAPAVSAMEPHRVTGTYARTPQLRAIAEVLGCTLVSLDASTLFDLVPVFTAGSNATVQLHSWRDVLAPPLAAQRGSPAPLAAAASPVLVIISNGQLGDGGHFDSTRPMDTAAQTGSSSAAAGGGSAGGGTSRQHAGLGPLDGGDSPSKAPPGKRRAR